MTKVETQNKFLLDYNGDKIFVGSKVKYHERFGSFILDYDKTYRVTKINSYNNSINLEDKNERFRSDCFELAEGKEYRLASFLTEYPVVIACNSREFEEEFEKSEGFAKWITDWTQW